MATGRALVAAGFPAPYLFAGLVIGIASALGTRRPPSLPRPIVTAAHGATGVTLGLFFNTTALAAVGGSWVSVTLVTLGTLLVSLAAGAALAWITGLDLETAALGLVAGGASGIVAMADELGADDRLVAFMQYLRVLIVVAVTPIVLGLGFQEAGGAGTTLSEDPLGTPAAWLVSLALLVAGVAVGRAARLPAPTLMGPLLLASVLALTLPGDALAVPPVLRETAFGLIGLQVGLRFTSGTVRHVRRLLSPLLVVVMTMLAASFGLAVLLDQASSISLLDAYLATTPGGAYAVVAASVSAGADTTFVTAVQSLRLLAMVLLAPLAIRLMVRWPALAAAR
jgi:membrane AbrB-like protein